MLHNRAVRSFQTVSSRSVCFLQQNQIHVTIDDLIAEDDTVAVRTTLRGTHRGVYAGTTPTGRQAKRTMIQIFCIVEDRISEEWYEGRGLLE